jgi:hypothetical protein
MFPHTMHIENVIGFKTQIKNPGFHQGFASYFELRGKETYFRLFTAKSQGTQSMRKENVSAKFLGTSPPLVV